MLFIFRKLLDIEDSDTMGVMHGTRLYKYDKKMQLCEIHILPRLVL